MSVQDFVEHVALCPVCLEPLGEWETYDGPGECNQYTLDELAQVVSGPRVSIQCVHKCRGKWVRASCDLEVVKRLVVVSSVQLD